MKHKKNVSGHSNTKNSQNQWLPPSRMMFPPLPNIDIQQLQMSDVSLYSMTPWREADLISQLIRKFFIGSHPILNMSGSQPVITDGTANVGGNTISFHLAGFQRVNSIEIDHDTCQMLCHNLRLYNCPTDHVMCLDYLSVYRTMEQDVVFLDPPWGGRDYSKPIQLELFLSGVNIIDICITLLKEHLTQLLVLKLPINYALPKLIHQLPATSILTRRICRGDHHSYNVVFCWNEDFSRPSI